MKKLLLCLLSAALLLCGCAAKTTVLNEAPSTVLVSIDGESIMTVEDLSRLMTQQEVSHDTKGTDLAEEKDVFEKEAESRILSYFAVKFGLQEATIDLNQEFDTHMEEIQDTQTYGNEKLFSDTLQKTLGMSDQEYKEWTVNENYISYNVQNLLDDISSNYKSIVDPAEMEEDILKNLEELTNMYDIRINYPGIAPQKKTFQHVL